MEENNLDPNRIGAVINLIAQVWQSRPYLTIGQLLLNVVSKDYLSKIDDLVLAQRLSEYYSSIKITK